MSVHPPLATGLVECTSLVSSQNNYHRGNALLSGDWGPRIFSIRINILPPSPLFPFKLLLTGSVREDLFTFDPNIYFVNRFKVGPYYTVIGVDWVSPYFIVYIILLNTEHACVKLKRLSLFFYTLGILLSSNWPFIEYFNSTKLNSTVTILVEQISLYIYIN